MKIFYRKIQNFLLKKLSYLLKKSPYRIQAQMDINKYSLWYNQKFINKTGGFYLKNNKKNSKSIIHNLEPWDNVRRDMIILLLKTIEEKKIAGDIVEVGVYKGLTARLIHKYLPDRKLHLFDTFEGFTEKAAHKEKLDTEYVVNPDSFSDTSIDSVKITVNPNQNVFFYKGFFPDTIPEDLKKQMFSFVHLDADLYDPILQGLNYFYPKMNNNGIILIHDYNSWTGARNAVDDFCKFNDILPVPMPDKSGSAIIIKSIKRNL